MSSLRAVFARRAAALRQLRAFASSSGGKPVLPKAAPKAASSASVPPPRPPAKGPIDPFASKSSFARGPGATLIVGGLLAVGATALASSSSPAEAAKRPAGCDCGDKCQCGADCKCGEDKNPGCDCGDKCQCGADCKCGPGAAGAKSSGCRCGDQCACGSDCACGEGKPSGCQCGDKCACGSNCACGSPSASKSPLAPFKPTTPLSSYLSSLSFPLVPPPIPTSALTSKAEDYVVGSWGAESGSPSAIPTLPSLTLYQYEVCPFCNKVRAFLDFHNIPYRVVEVNPLTKKELKGWTEYRKVPVIVTGSGEQWVDSTAIINKLEAYVEAREQAGKRELARDANKDEATKSPGLLARLFGGASGAPEAASSSAAATASSGASSYSNSPAVVHWRRWADDWLVRVLTVNIYRTARESWQTFGYIGSEANFGPAQGWFARLTGAPLMRFVSGRMVSKYHVDGDLRERLVESGDAWAAAVERSPLAGPFHGGVVPDLADLAVFGVLRAVAGTDAFNDLMAQSKIGQWYAKMFEQVGDSARLQD